MPVVVQGDSEYQRNFKWNPSRKSRSYSPPLQSLKPAAGVPSNIAGKASEPTITTKKKIHEPKPTSTTKFEVDADDYMLLGNNDKFAANVKYRSKSRDRALNIRKTHQPASDGDMNTPDAPRDPAPPPKVIYDTGAPKPKVKQNAEPPKVSKAVEVQNGKHVPSKSVLKAPPAEPKARTQVVKPVQSQSEPVIRESRQPQQKPAKQAKLSKPQPKPVDKREKRKGNLNEFAQTDLAKGVADSGQEAPAGYALKYQKGVAPLRNKGPKRLSEYEMQFKWRKGLPSSPMLDAEQLVYKNNPQAPPFRPDSMAKSSEYKAQFQAWHLMKSSPDLSQAVKQEEMRGAAKRTLKHKRSHSLEDLTPDQRPAAGVEAVVTVEDKRMVKESLNPQRLHFPHGKNKRCKSEYASNFAAPQKFDYTMGAWIGADPPHIVNRPDTGSILSQDGGSKSKAWFSEVLELRKKAEEYKRRAQGTHFSREHVAQLYAQQAEMWDTVSTQGESIVSALSLESARSSRASSVKGKKRRGDSVGGSLQLDVDQLSSPHMGTVTPLSERTLTPDLVEEEVNDLGDDVTSCSGTAMSVDLTPGRIPTPQFKGKTKNKTRHHLDRTTPSVGGAILTSPSKDSHIVTKKAPSVDAWVETPDNVVRESFSAPGHLQPSNVKLNAFGKPTHDSHVLVDEETASDHTLRLDYVKSRPQIEQAKQDLATRLSTIKEVSGEYRSTGKSSGVITPAVTLGNLRNSSPVRVSQPLPNQMRPDHSAVTKPVKEDKPIVRQPIPTAHPIIQYSEHCASINSPHQNIMDGLNSINRSDLVELKSLAAPPAAVKLVLEAICVLMGVKPEKRMDPKAPGKMILDYWPVSKKLMADVMSFLTELKNYNKDDIPHAVMTKIRTQYITNPDFNLGRIKDVSSATVGLAKWVLALEEYDRVSKMRQGNAAPTKHTPPSRNQDVSAQKPQEKVVVVQQMRHTTPGVYKPKPAVQTVESNGINQAKRNSVLNAAQAVIDSVKKADIQVLKSLSNPPHYVKVVMEAVCILFGVKPVTTIDLDDPSKKIVDYWPATKKLLGDSNFLVDLKQYDIDNIPPAAMQRIRNEYISDPEFSPEKVAVKAKAAASLCNWVLALEQYDRIKKGKTIKTAAAVESKKKKATSPTMNQRSLSELEELEQLRRLVKQLEMVVNEQTSVVEGLKQDKSMSHAIPALESVRKALLSLHAGDITELKSMSNPPQIVKTVMEAVCLLMGLKPNQVIDVNNPGQKVSDYWPQARKLLGDPKFLSRLLTFDKDNIPEPVMTKVRTQYCYNPEFTVNKVHQVSRAAESLLQWVLNIEAYDRIAKCIGPKMRNLRHAEQVLEMRKVQLNTKRGELKAMEQRVRSLQQHYSKVNNGQSPGHKAPNTQKRLNHSQDLWQNQISREEIPKIPLEDDAVSLSAQSIASTCSQASELYERARHRKDQFW